MILFKQKPFEEVSQSPDSLVVHAALLADLIGDLCWDYVLLVEMAWYRSLFSDADTETWVSRDIKYFFL